LSRVAQARAARDFGAALVWAETAAALDSESEHANPLSPVNVALFQIVYDSACDSENLVTSCGNVTTTHGDWLSYGQEAIDLLVSRLGANAPQAVRSMAIVVQGHFNNLFDQLDRHFDRDALYTLTSGQEAKLLLDTTKTVRQLIAAQETITIAKEVDLAKRGALLQICVASPDYLVVPFYTLRFLNSWDKAVFFIEAAQGIVAELKTTPAFAARSINNRDALLADLDAALESARALTSGESKLAKRSYQRMNVLGNQLGAALAG
jgi:hypothetical protein